MVSSSADAEFVGGSEGESVFEFEFEFEFVFVFVFEGGARARNCGTCGRDNFKLPADNEVCRPSAASRRPPVAPEVDRLARGSDALTAKLPEAAAPD